MKSTYILILILQIVSVDYFQTLTEKLISSQCHLTIVNCNLYKANKWKQYHFLSGTYMESFSCQLKFNSGLNLQLI